MLNLVGKYTNPMDGMGKLQVSHETTIFLDPPTSSAATP